MNLCKANIKKTIRRLSFLGLLLTLSANTNTIVASTNHFNSYSTVEFESSTGFATVENYITRYKHIAIEEMQNVGIPASIKLAQAILESSYGNSNLALEANNHFGIKCGGNWSGMTIYKDDDTANECFRKYRNSYESYIDHSQFLEKPRYAALFNIPITDYKSWARGLQSAGYATNPEYANKLIEIIERHRLYKIDEAQAEKEVVMVVNNTAVSPVESSRQFESTDYQQATTGVNRPASSVRKASGRINATEPLYYNGIKTIILNEAVTAKQVELLYGIDADKICAFNNVAPNEVIPSNTKIYLQPMRNEAPKNMVVHTVEVGETMEEISQYYGIKLSKLYKRNKIRPGQQPAPGAVVYLRGKSKYTPTVSGEQYSQKSTDSKETTVVIEDEKTNQYNNTTTTYNQTSVTDRNYYDIEPKEYKYQEPTNTNTKTAVSYYNGNDNEYSNYKPVTINKVEEKAEDNFSGVTTTVVEKVGDAISSTEATAKTYYNSAKEAVNTATDYYKTVTTPKTNVTVSKQTTTTDNNTSYYDTTYNNDYYTSSSNNSEYDVTTPTTNNVTSTVSSSSYTYTSPPSSGYITHFVVKGDTLYNISKRNNTTVERIKELNGLRNNVIKLGQQIKVQTNTIFY